jgi:hypothetical protein
MTVPTQSPIEKTTLPQGQTLNTLNFTFTYIEKQTIEVSVNGSLLSQSLYSVVNQTITFVPPLVGITGDSTIIVYLDITINRTNDLLQNSPIYAKDLNNQLDNLTLMMQQAQNGLGRSIVINPADAEDMNTILPVAASRSNKALIFKTDGSVDVSVDDYVNQATNAAASALSALNSKNSASASELKASQWADSPTEVETGRYSAKKWADQSLLLAIPDGSIERTKFTILFSNNTASGLNSLLNNTTGGDNTAFGASALKTNTTGIGNTAFGTSALTSNISGNSNTAVGISALQNNTATGNTAVGSASLQSNTTGVDNTAFGSSSLLNNTIGVNNTAVGVSALQNNTASGSSNTAVGFRALKTNTAFGNTAVGVLALNSNVSGFNNTAVGVSALDWSSFYNYSNTSGFGFEAQVTGDNQIQLGNDDTTTYVYGTVANRSDIRDKCDIRNTILGLDFINKIIPVDYKYDMRDFYRPEIPKIPYPNKPSAPIEPIENKYDNIDNYDIDKAKYDIDKAKYDVDKAKYDVDKKNYDDVMSKFIENSKLANITHDGSKKRVRYHHGVIAQDIKQIIDDTNIDFGGYQDHKVKGGDDVLSIGYDEFIAPLIKAVQELSKKVKDLEDKVLTLS